MVEDRTTARHDEPGRVGPAAGRRALLDEARVELEQAASDLEELTGELYARTRLVEKLEVLVNDLLDVLATPAVLVDPEGRIAAMSRGAAAVFPELNDGLGRLATGLLPALAIEAIAGHEHAGSDGATPPTGKNGRGVRVRGLPDGSVLVVLGMDGE